MPTPLHKPTRPIARERRRKRKMPLLFSTAARTTARSSASLS